MEGNQKECRLNAGASFTKRTLLVLFLFYSSWALSGKWYTAISASISTAEVDHSIHADGVLLFRRYLTRELI